MSYMGLYEIGFMSRWVVDNAYEEEPWALKE